VDEVVPRTVVPVQRRRGDAQLTGYRPESDRFGTALDEQPAGGPPDVLVGRRPHTTPARRLVHSDILRGTRLRAGENAQVGSQIPGAAGTDRSGGYAIGTGDPMSARRQNRGRTVRESPL